MSTTANRQPLTPYDVADELDERLNALTAAAEAVCDCWEHGDLAGAVAVLEGEAIAARELLDRCRSDE